jgi:site-specific DNA-methyltransferase (adenine-specific)
MIRRPGRKRVDDISPSRYISHVRVRDNRLTTTKVRARFVGYNGVFVEGDCLDVLANMRSNSVNLVFLDPPFNIRKQYDRDDFDDDVEPEIYKGLCRTWILEAIRVLRPGGALFIYHLPKFLIDLGAWLNSIHLVDYKAWIALKMKSGFPIKGRIHPAHYGLLYYTKTSGNPTFNVVRQRSPKCRRCSALVRDYGGYRDKYKKYEYEGDVWIQISDFWEDTRPASHDKLRDSKINELPLQIAERAILLASKRGDVILDCFAGGGSTLHAAERNGRKWIGIDVASYKSSLSRIKAFLVDDETSTPGTRIQSCFTKQFVRAALTIDPASKTRPIKRVHAIKNISGDKFRSNSRIFEVLPSSRNGSTHKAQ